MPKAIIYARYSPRRKRKRQDGQEKDCVSNETQIDYCREFCEEEGFEIADEFQDKALSGDDEDRPGLWKAIDAIGRGYYLVVYRFDRLARSAFLMTDIKRKIYRRKGAIISATNEGKMDAHMSPEEQMRFGALELFAIYERQMIARRTKAAMKHHQKHGLRMSRVDRCPYGWTIDPTSPVDPESGLNLGMVPDPIEQDTIERMKELRGQGLPLRRIVDVLMSEDRFCRGLPWHAGTIARILRRIA